MVATLWQPMGCVNDFDRQSPSRPCGRRRLAAWRAVMNNACRIRRLLQLQLVAQFLPDLRDVGVGELVEDLGGLLPGVTRCCVITFCGKGIAEMGQGLRLAE